MLSPPLVARTGSGLKKKKKKKKKNNAAVRGSARVRIAARVRSGGQVCRGLPLSRAAHDAPGPPYAAVLSAPAHPAWSAAVTLFPRRSTITARFLHVPFPV